MEKKVIVVASGETERRSLPHLTARLAEEGIHVTEVRIPPRHRGLTISVAVQLIDAAWFEYQYTDPPDKFVILLDVDGKDSAEVLRPWRRDLRHRLNPRVAAYVQFAYAQWHLEAWFFADARNLRNYLGRDLGNVDASKPDEIQNPKEHLKRKDLTAAGVGPATAQPGANAELFKGLHPAFGPPVGNVVRS